MTLARFALAFALVCVGLDASAQEAPRPGTTTGQATGIAVAPPITIGGTATDDVYQALEELRDRDVADMTSGAATSGYCPKADGIGGVDWASCAGGGSGDVTGGSTSTVDDLAIYSATGGKTIGNSATGLARIRPHATAGAGLVLQEGADDGTNTFTLKAPDSGMAGNVSCTVTSAGLVPVSCLVGAPDLVGPGSATDNAIVRFDATTGKLVQNSAVTIGDTGAATGFSTINATGAVTALSFTATAAPSADSGLTLDEFTGATPSSPGPDQVKLAVTSAGRLDVVTPLGVIQPVLKLEPGASTADEVVPRYNATTGELQSSPMEVDDAGVVTGTTNVMLSPGSVATGAIPYFPSTQGTSPDESALILSPDDTTDPVRITFPELLSNGAFTGSFSATHQLTNTRTWFGPDANGTFISLATPITGLAGAEVIVSDSAALGGFITTNVTINTSDALAATAINATVGTTTGRRTALGMIDTTTSGYPPGLPSGTNIALVNDEITAGTDTPTLTIYSPARRRMPIVFFPRGDGAAVGAGPDIAAVAVEGTLDEGTELCALYKGSSCVANSCLDQDDTTGLTDVVDCTVDVGGSGVRFSCACE